MKAEEAKEIATNVVNMEVEHSLKDIYAAIKQEAERGNYFLTVNIKNIRYLSLIQKGLEEDGYSYKIDTEFLEINW